MAELHLRYPNLRNIPQFKTTTAAHIYNHLKNNGAITANNRRTFGFQRGYIDYLDIVERLPYWQGYFKYIWDRHPEMHERYQHLEDYWLNVIPQ